jgi:hypothetical protein
LPSFAFDCPFAFYLAPLLVTTASSKQQAGLYAQQQQQQQKAKDAKAKGNATYAFLCL